MLNEKLMENATMEGRSVDMKVIATGDIHEAYDIYIDVSAYSDKVSEVDGKETRLSKIMFVRLIYWKKSFEKYVVVEISSFLHTRHGLEMLDHMWRSEQSSPENPHVSSSEINHVLVCTMSIASWELVRRNKCIPTEEAPGLDHKCYDGPHGFVRSDKSDNFDIPPVSSFPVTTLVV